VALGREVHDGARAVFGQQAVEQRAVADVALHEGWRASPCRLARLLAVAGVGQGVEVDDRLVPIAPASPARSWSR
jgi:hypothetical protein